MLFQVLSEEDVARVCDASLAILESIGVNLQHPGARELLAEHGCSISGERARIPAPLVERALAQVPRSFLLYGRSLTHSLHYGGGETHLRPSGGMTYIVDLETGERRIPVLRDAQEMVRIQDALPNYHITNSIVYPSDVNPEMVSVISFLNTCQFSDKPNDATVVTGAEARAVARIGAVIRGREDALRDRPLMLLYVSPTSPLSYAYEQVEAVLEVARAGIPLGVATCPVMGVAAPITLAGVLAQQTAEVLSSVVIAQLVRPGVPVVYCARANGADMHSGASLWGGPEVGLATAASAQVAHRFGLPSNGYGLGTCAKTMDEQAGFEKAINGLLPALAGCDVVTGGGLLEDVLSVSHQQLVIDDEIMSMVYRCLRGITVNQGTLAHEVIERVMGGSSFLAEAHTRKFLRAGEQWQARLADRQLFHEWQVQGAKRIEERAAEKARQILDTHHVEPLAAEVQREIDAILAATRREVVRVVG